jgi:hypothetical protein
MCIAALFIITNITNQSRHPKTGAWIKKILYKYTGE